MRATPIVSVVAILSLALGIGANTAIFSIIDSLMLRTLPVSDPQQLVIVDLDNGVWTNPLWEQIRDRRDLFAGAFAYTSTRFDLSSGGQTEYANGIWASGRYFLVRSLLFAVEARDPWTFAGAALVLAVAAAAAAWIPAMRAARIDPATVLREG